MYGITWPKIYYKGNKFIGGYTELVDFVKPTFDYEKLKNLSKVLTYNLNNIIDYNYYPIPETLRSNKRHRPIGIGVQGLANVFYEMKTPFGSDESRDINKKIFESIYYGSLEASMEIARDRSKDLEVFKTGIHCFEPDNERFVSEDVLRGLNETLKPIDQELDREDH